MRPENVSWSGGAAAPVAGCRVEGVRTTGCARARWREAAECDGPAPLVLLFGMPRSGTTWLGKIFDSHPDTIYLHEPDSRFPLRDVPLLLTEADAQSYASRLQTFAATLPRMSSVHVRGKLPLFSKRYRSPAGDIVHRAGTLGAKALARVFGDAPVYGTNQAAATTIVWKSVESMGRLPALLDALSEPRAIYIVRHPCGYASSVLRGESSGKFRHTTSAADDMGVFEQLVNTPTAHRLGITLDALVRLTPLARLAWRWLLFNERVLERAGAEPRLRVVRYEDLCERPAEVASDLFAFATLTFERQTDRFLEASTRNQRNGYYGVHKNSRRTARRWREELSAAERAAIEQVVSGTRCGGLYAIG